MSIIPFNNSDGELFYLKTNHIKSQPPLKMSKIKSAYFHNCSHNDMCTIWSLLYKNIKVCKNNIKYGHDYILNSLDYFNLIIINDFLSEKEIDSEYIERFIDILSDKGELIIFCTSENKYNKLADVLDKSLKKKFYERNLVPGKDNIFLKVITIIN